VITLLIGWLFALEAAASPARRTWIFEQLSTLPPPTTNEQPRTEASFSSASYENNLSAQASATADFSVLEVRALGSYRLLGDHQIGYLDGLSNTAGALAREQQTLGLEIGRYHALTEKHYGRIGLGYLEFFPDGNRLLHLSIATGIMPQAVRDWEFQWAINIYGSLNRGWTVLMIHTETLRSIDENLLIGGFFQWSYIMIGTLSNDLQTESSPGVLEHLGFSIGPVLDWKIGSGTLRAAIPLRMYVDRDVSLSSQNLGPTSYPTEFPIPSVELSFSLLL
jgi:hypothetical protein